MDLVAHHHKNENVFIVRNTSGTPALVDLAIDGDAFLEFGAICIDLGEALFTNWQVNGGTGGNIWLSENGTAKLGDHDCAVANRSIWRTTRALTATSRH